MYWSVRAPALFGLVAARVDDWQPMPDGRWYHRECIHTHREHVLVTMSTPCPHGPPRSSPPIGADGHDFIHRTTAASTASTAQYYSDWVVYAQHTSPNGLRFMSSTWRVPRAPSSRGPLGLSSVYLFNGLEDSSGRRGTASMIMQPVLQYGKSGCVLDPLSWDEWHWIAYLVSGSGRAHCGKILKVREGETLIGNMSRTDGGAANASHQAWTILAARQATGEISSLSSQLSLDAGRFVDTAYATLEGMLIYSCAAFPSAPSTSFIHNKLVDGDGRSIAIGATAAWLPEARHTECGQSAIIEGNGVTVRYRNATKDVTSTP